MSINLAMRLYFSAKENGGGTFWRSGNPVITKEGYVVGGFAPSLKFPPGNTVQDIEKVAEWADNNYSVSYGSWEDEGLLYFDVVEIFRSLDFALSVARKNNQLAIWSLAEGKEIRLEQEQEENGGEDRA